MKYISKWGLCIGSSYSIRGLDQIELTWRFDNVKNVVDAVKLALGNMVDEQHRNSAWQKKYMYAM